MQWHQTVSLNGVAEFLTQHKLLACVALRCVALPIDGKRPSLYMSFHSHNVTRPLGWAVHRFLAKMQ